MYRPMRLAFFTRRIVDISIASIMLVLTAPIIAVAALAIFLEDGAPIVFRQRRAGRFERTFVMFKLRTMRRADCGNRPAPTSGADPRITSVGRILRKTSIDELPQLVNVLRGEMTLIGPRPEMPLIIDGYEYWQHLRHLVTPGLTCIWQATCRKSIPLNHPDATALDIEYIERASPALDGKLLVKTFLSIISLRGAY